MRKFVNVKEQFFELLSNNAISDGRITTNPNNLPNSPTKVEISFNEINVNESMVTFYDDPEEDRAELVGVYYIDFNQVDRVTYHKDLLSLDGLYGAFDAVLHFKDGSQVLISFNIRDRNSVPPLWEFATKKRPKRPTIFDELVSPAETKKQYLDAILNHKGWYLININSSDFVESGSSIGIEAFSLVFTSIKQLRSKELLCFDNSKIQPIKYTEQNVPVYPMSFSSSFYITAEDIISIGEIDAEAFRDVFEYPTQRIFNLHMRNESIVTIGFLE